MSSDPNTAEAYSLPRRGRRRARRRTRLAITLSVATLLLVGGAYTAACALAPLPELQFSLEGEPEITVGVEGSVAQAAVDAQALPTAIGWADGTEVWTNDEQTYPLGSVSKLITVLVALEDGPV